MHKIPKCKSLRVYLREIYRYKICSEGEEQAIGKRIVCGDQEAVTELILRNLRLVVKIARNYLATGVSREDLISAGNIGLIKAAPKFKYWKGRFSTFASMYIKGSILEVIGYQAMEICVSVSTASLLRSAYVIRSKLNNQGRYDPNYILEALTERYPKVSRKRILLVVSFLIKNRIRYVEYPDLIDSLEEDVVPICLEFCEEMLNPEEELFLTERNETIEDVLARIGGRGEMILRKRYGLDGKDPMTLDQIGQQCFGGLSRERVRQIEKRAIVRIRSFKKFRKLQDFY
ncbi:MAG: sigma-70 family RNA polymerase sigma factor [Patescibacteria group bacterium]